MKREEKRESKRRRCSISVEFSVYSDKPVKGKTSLKDISDGGFNLIMKRAPEEDTVIAINGDRKKLERYVDYNKILRDSKGNPLVRVCHIVRNTKKRVYNVGVRFLSEVKV